MDVARATQHATAVAREAVNAGLAEQDAVRLLYQDYTKFLAKGIKGTFTQLLLSRGLIDQTGYAQLQQKLPPTGIVPGSDRLHSSMTSRASGVASLGGVPPKPGEETGVFDKVIKPPAGLGTQTPSGSGELELAIPSDFVPVSGGQTIEVLDFDPAVVSRPVDSTTGSRGSSGSRPPPEDHAPDPAGAFMLSDEVEPEDMGKTVEEEPPPQVGDVLGHYTLVGTIGRGGMGVIFEAKKKGSEESVALKVLLGAHDLGSDRRRQRFRREVEAMRRLEHDHIVAVYDYGRKGPFDWYTMDYVQGKDFKTLLEEDDLEYAEKIQIFEDMCEAMSHAHERSVIHRDLKPENVLVDNAGRGHVLDFGLAKILDQEIGMTRTGSALGTPYYMAPEQLRSSKHIDQRADVFSLGVILYEITTGVRPFEGETAAEVGNRILTTEPPRPTKVKPDLHPDIDAMVIKALEKDPERRYQDANSLYADLIRHRRGFKVEGASGLSGAVGAARRWASLNRGQLIGLVAGGVLSAVMFVVLLLALRSDDKEPDSEGKTKVASKTPDKTTDEGPAKTKTGPGPAPSKTSSPSPKPTKTSQPTPSTTKSPQPSPSPSPKPTKSPRPRPSKTPTPEPTRIKQARTPVEQARLALIPPDEPARASGAEEVAALEEELGHQFMFQLEERLIPAMAVGDTGRAERALKALKTHAEVKIGAELALEIEHDIKTMRLMRRLLGELVREKAGRLRVLSFHGGAKVGLKIKKALVKKDGFLRVETSRGARWLEVDPLCLQTRTLRDLMITRQPGIDDSPAHYAMAVIGLWRGKSEIDRQQREHFDKAVRDSDGRGAAATGRRRKLANWLKDARVQHRRWFEEQAAKAWRDVQRVRNKSGSCLRELDQFLERFGRSEEYQKRREEWIALHVRHTKSLDRLLKGKVSSGAGKASWSFKRGEVGDFEVEPLRVGDKDNPRPFRAEAQSSALMLENAKVTLPLQDLVCWEGEVFFSSNSEGPITAHLTGFEQELTRRGYVVTFKGKEVAAERDRKYKFDGRKRVEWNLEGEGDERKMELFFRFPQVKLEVPFKNYERQRDKKPKLEVSSLHDLRLALIRMSWRLKDNPDKARVLRDLLVQRRLLKKEGLAGVRHGFRLQLQEPDRMTGFLLDGEWKPGRYDMSAGPKSRLFALQWAELGVLRFKYAAADGPGVRLHLAQAIDRPGTTVNWHLPSLLNPDPDRFREVTVIFNLPAQAVTVLVDGVRLSTRTKRLPRGRAFFGIEFLHTTKGRIKDFELIQFRPRKL